MPARLIDEKCEGRYRPLHSAARHVVRMNRPKSRTIDARVWLGLLMMAGFDSGKSVSDLFSHGFSCYQNGRLDEALEI